MKGERDLQLLVCTGNLGNAPPDHDSINHWIPYNGRCVDVIVSSLPNEQDEDDEPLIIQTLVEEEDEDDETLVEDGDDDVDEYKKEDENNNTEKKKSSSTTTKKKLKSSSMKSSGKKSQKVYSVGQRTGMKYPIQHRYDLPKLYGSKDNNTTINTSDISLATTAGDSSRYFESVKNNNSDQCIDPSLFYTNDDHYDIIVIGMQEATFNPPATTNNNNNTNATTAATITDSSATFAPITTTTAEQVNGNSVETQQGDKGGTMDSNRTQHQKGIIQKSAHTLTGAVSGVTGAVTGVVMMPIKQVKAIQGLAGGSKDHTKKSSSRHSFNHHQQQHQQAHEQNEPYENSANEDHTTSNHNNNDATEENPFHGSIRSGSMMNYMGSPDASIMSMGTTTNNNKSSSTNIVKATLSTIKNVSTDILTTDWLDGTPYLHNIMDARLPSYERIVSYQRGEMRLEVYVHKSQLLHVQVLHIDAKNTGRAGLANKGGIATELLLHGTTRLSFVTAHLEAHEGQGKYTIRCKTMGDILDGTKQMKNNNTTNNTKQKPIGYPDVTCTSHHSFVMGDLNFRSEVRTMTNGSSLPIMNGEEQMEYVQSLVSKQNWIDLNRIDELGHAIQQNDCLYGFQTLLCNFPPTFKVLRQKGYTYKHNRRPSYTDRILWKTGHLVSNNDETTPSSSSSIQPIVYEPIDSFTTSDHKPIRCAFTIKLNESYHLRPRMTRQRSSRRQHNFNSQSSRRGSHGSSNNDRRSFFDKIPSAFYWTNSYNEKNNKNEKKVQMNVAHKDRLHLFVTELKCIIHNTHTASTATTNNPTGTPIYNDDKLPNPFICLLSTPDEILASSLTTKTNPPTDPTTDPTTKRSLKKAVQKRMNRWFFFLPHFSSQALSTTHLPQTSIQKETLTPSWSNEEVHVEINTHNPDGSPLELSSSMLHLCLLNHPSLLATNEDPTHKGTLKKTTNKKRSATAAAASTIIVGGGGSNSGDIVSLGSFTFNVSHLIRSCPPPTTRRNKKKNTTNTNNNTNNGGDGIAPATSFASSNSNKNSNNATTTKNKKDLKHEFRKTANILKMFGPGGFRGSGTNPNNNNESGEVQSTPTDVVVVEEVDEEEDDPVASFVVSNEALLKNGIEIGRISCKIECWWIDEATANVSRFGLHKAGGTNANTKKNNGISSSRTNNNKNKTSKRHLFPNNKDTNKQQQHPVGGGDDEEQQQEDDNPAQQNCNGTVFGKTSSGREIMLKQRKLPISQSTS